MTRRHVTIGLLWHSTNSDNLGVGALTVSQIAVVQGVAQALDVEARFIILGWRDPGRDYVAGPLIEAAPLRTRDLVRPSGLYRHARRCDFVLDIGAGDSFADIYGPSRALKIIAAKFAVLAARRPLILSPQTIGPFSRWWTRRLAVLAMSRAQAVFTRDALSTRFMAELGLADRALEATDVALRLPYVEAERPAGAKARVGLNFSGLLINGGYTKNNMFSLAADYPQLARALIATFHDRADCEVHLVSHVISTAHPVEDDYAAAEALAAEFPGVIVAPRFASPSEAKSYISGLDFFCGSRMHACVAAFSSGVAVAPLAYSRKFAGLFGTLGYDHTVDCRETSIDEAVARITNAFEAREALRAEIEKCMADGMRRLGLYEDALRKAISAAAGVDALR